MEGDTEDCVEGRYSLTVSRGGVNIKRRDLSWFSGNG